MTPETSTIMSATPRELFLDETYKREGLAGFSIRDTGDHLKYLMRKVDAERAARFRQRYDSDGCDETCGFCKPGSICFWHVGVSVPWPRVVTLEDAERLNQEQRAALRRAGFRPLKP